MALTIIKPQFRKYQLIGFIIDSIYGLRKPFHSS